MNHRAAHTRRSIRVALATMTLGLLLGAKPAGGPVNPHGSGRERSPIEREFHLTPVEEPLWTEPTPNRPKPRFPREALEALVALQWGRAAWAFVFAD